MAAGGVGDYQETVAGRAADPLALKTPGLAAWQKPPWVEVHALAPPTAWKRVLAWLWRRIRSLGPLKDFAVDDAAAAAELEEKLAAALTGLVPKPRPDATRSQLVVEYGETTRDQSPTWRARVVDQVSARLGTSFRASWDRPNRRFTLHLVPKLPHPIDWSEQTAAHRSLDLGPWVAAYGTDEDGNIIAWQPGDREPHAMITGDPGTGKALDVATPIPTPTGWTAMGELRIGDLVFDETGRPTRVTGVFDQPVNRPCYEVVFSDGSILIADEEHRWWTEDFTAEVPRRRIKRAATSQRRRSQRPAPEAVRLRRLAASPGGGDTAAPGPAEGAAGPGRTSRLHRLAANKNGGRPASRVSARIYAARHAAVIQSQQVLLHGVTEVYTALPCEAGGCAHASADLHPQAPPLAADDHLATADLSNRVRVAYPTIAGWLTSEDTSRMMVRRRALGTVTGQPVIRGNSAPDLPRAALLSTPATVGGRPIPDRRTSRAGGRVVTTGADPGLVAGIAGSVEPFDCRRRAARPADGRPSNCPYTLGCWLGDGSSRSAGLRVADPEILAHIRDDGYEILHYIGGRDRSNRWTDYTTPGLGTDLWKLGLLKSSPYREPQKHIPARYLRASIDQRKALLAGLLDTGGTINRRGAVEYTSTVEALAGNVRELALTLGYRATSRKHTRRFNGRICRSAWTVSFTTTEPVFRLQHKIDTQTGHTARALPDRIRHRSITAVSPVSSRPVRCIEVDSPNHLYLAGQSMIPTHNTETMKAVVDSLLLQGALVAIIDPKQQDFAEYLGRPGVVCVATDIADQVGALVDIEAEMMRRTAAKALARLIKQFPTLARDENARNSADRRLPAQAAIDEVPLILVLDELTQHVAQVQEWWRSLAPAAKARWGAEKSRQAPMLTIPASIVRLARSIKIHMLIGVQRPDAGNFGGSTTMRDNIKHMASMGQQSRIGSEMQWGDGRTGSEVQISHPGEGVSNGLRLNSRTGEQLGRGVPGRFKAWYVADTAETDDFWAKVAAVAPDATLVRLPHVSDAARDPVAAGAALRAKAYEEYSHGQPERAHTGGEQRLTDQESAADGTQSSGAPTLGQSRPPTLSVVKATLTETDRVEQDRQIWDPLLADAAALVVSRNNGSAAMLQRELRIGYERGRQLMSELETTGVVGPVQGRKARKVNFGDLSELPQHLRERGVFPDATSTSPSLRLVPADRQLAETASGASEVAADPYDLLEVEVDEADVSWQPIPPIMVEEGDVVQFGDYTFAVVLDVPAYVTDEFDGSEVIRLVLDVYGGEEVVDLSEDDVIHRRTVR